MSDSRTTRRRLAGLLAAGAVVLGTVLGGTGPAQASTGWNDTVAPAAAHHKHAHDTGWNGT